MRKIGFIGAYDKTDMVVYVARILTECGKKVMVVDSTLTQKARYIVPKMESAPAYITEFEGIDVAVGFRNFGQIKQYSFIEQSQDLPYDYILIDIDNPYNIPGFELDETCSNFFVTAFDSFSLKRGLEIVNALPYQLKLTKILYSKQMLKEENDYLNYLSNGTKAIWNKEIIYFQLENGDYSVIIENQKVCKIKFRKLSTQFKDSLEYITAILSEKDLSSSDVRKAIKNIEKNG